MGQLQVPWDRIWRRRVLVLVVALVAGLGALAASLLQGPSYTGRAALAVQSADRTPEQDSVLAQGYADLFNQPSSQEALRKEANVPADVAVTSRIAAASPILYIEATSANPDEAAGVATRMSITFRDLVRRNLGGGLIDDLQRQLGAVQQRLNALPTTSSGRDPLNETATQLQKRINDLQTTARSNELRDLQPDAGVSSNPSGAKRNTAAGLLGGLVVGALAALVLGRFENRMVTPSEVQDRLGLETLAVVAGSRGGENDREERQARRLRALVPLVGSAELPVPGALAVTSPRASGAKSQVAVSMAVLRARQGQTTLLLQADLEHTSAPEGLAGRPGVAEFLSARRGARLEGKVFGDGRGLLVVPPGSERRTETYELFSRAQLSDLLRQGRHLADLVIIDVPPIVDSTEAQLACSVADRTVLVVEEGETRSANAVAAVDALRHAQAAVLGTVVVQNSAEFGDLGLLTTQQWSVVPMPSTPGAPQAAGPPRRPATVEPRPRSAPPAPARDSTSNDRTGPIPWSDLERYRRDRERGSSATAGPARADAAGPVPTGAVSASTSDTGRGADPKAPPPVGKNGTGTHDAADHRSATNGSGTNGPGTHKSGTTNGSRTTEVGKNTDGDSSAVSRADGSSPVAGKYGRSRPAGTTSAGRSGAIPEGEASSPRSGATGDKGAGPNPSRAVGGEREKGTVKVGTVKVGTVKGREQSGAGTEAAGPAGRAEDRSASVPPRPHPASTSPEADASGGGGREGGDVAADTVALRRDR